MFLIPTLNNIWVIVMNILHFFYFRLILSVVFCKKIKLMLKQ